MQVIAFEDDAATLQALREAFAKFHIDFSGYSAPPADIVDIVAHAHPNAVISDINMPGMNGLELGMRLHGDPRTIAVPIYYYSSMPHATIQHEVASIGNAAFFSKLDLSPAQLVEAIRNMFQQDRWSP